MDLSSFTGPMLALAGVVLQYTVRQFRGMYWSGYWLAVIALSGFVYWLTIPDPFAGGAKLAIVRLCLWMVGATAAVRGGSGVTDALAKNTVAKDPRAAGKFSVPVTRSLP